MNDYKWPEPIRQTALPLAPEGIPLIGAGAFITAVFALLELALPAMIGLLVTLFICYFFRDPDRVVPQKAFAVIAPADGKVIAVTPVDQSPFKAGNFTKISIFMSVFNVHVNRMPVAGRISRIVYHPGKFVNASLDKASEHNERNALEIEMDDGRALGLVQVAGLVARRIICRVREDDRLQRGQRFGIICFGSRVDLYLPPDCEPKVGPGDNVTAGSTIVAVLSNPDDSDR